MLISMFRCVLCDQDTLKLKKSGPFTLEGRNQKNLDFKKAWYMYIHVYFQFAFNFISRQENLRP